MKQLLTKLGNRNAHTDIVFFCIIWIAMAPVTFIVVGWVIPAVLFWFITSIMIVIDVECGNNGLTLTP